MKIGGFQPPRLNPGELEGQVVLKGVSDTLKSVLGDLSRSDFEGARMNPLGQLAGPWGLSAPPRALAAKAPGMSANGNTAIAGATGHAVSTSTQSDPRAEIAREFGSDMVAEFDKMTPAQKQLLLVQAKIQTAGQMMTALLAAIHEMSKAVIQNFRA